MSYLKEEQEKKSLQEAQSIDNVKISNDERFEVHESETNHSHGVIEIKKVDFLQWSTLFLNFILYWGCFLGVGRLTFFVLL